MSVKKEIWKLAWPVMLVTTFNTLYGIINLKFIAMLGTGETAGVVIANSLMGVIFVLPTLISAGTIAIASRNVGSCNEDEFNHVSIQSLLYALLAGVVVYILSFIFKRNLLEIFNVTQDVYGFAESYVDIMFFVIPVNFMVSVLVAVLHAKGNTKTPMWAMGLANFINIFFGWLFIVKLRFGVEGAAFATLIGQCFSFVFLIFNVFKLLEIKLISLLKEIKLDMHILKRIVRIGFFAVLYGITRPFTGMLMFKITAESGKEAVAAFGIGGQIFSLIFILLGGLEVAIAIMVGQSLGSKAYSKIDKLIKEGIKVALINVIVFSVPYVVFAKQLMLAFTKDPNVVAAGVNYLRIVYAGMLFIGYISVYNAAFRGAGDTKPPMYGALAANWAAKIPLAYLLSRLGMKADGVWTAIAASLFVEFIIVWFFFRKGQWRDKEV